MKLLDHRVVATCNRPAVAFGPVGAAKPDEEKARTNAPTVMRDHPSIAIAAAHAASRPRVTRLRCAVSLVAAAEAGRTSGAGTGTLAR